MNIKQFFCIIIIFVSFTDCSVDYELPESFIQEADYLVINALLSPQEPIRIHFYQTAKTDSGYACIPIKGARVLLKENDQVLFDAVCEDSVLEVQYYPKERQYYSLEASVNERKIVTASTTIPASATCSSYIHLGQYHYSYENYIRLSSFYLDAQNRESLWITAYDIFDTGMVAQCDEIYTNHPLVDKFNRIEGTTIRNSQIGSLYHDVFLRIKNTNLQLFDNLFFMPERTNLVNVEPLDWNTPPAQYQVKLIMASQEYDQYCKSLFEQKSMIIYEEDMTAIFYHPLQVYSNIRGGLGIFAGMNETNYFFDAFP